MTNIRSRMTNVATLVPESMTALMALRGHDKDLDSVAQYLGTSIG